MRLKLTVRGAVQGVGFRPFVFRLATALGLNGWVNNSPQGVFIEVEGPMPELEKFLLRLEAEKPPRSSIQSLEPRWLDPLGYDRFEIRPSEAGGAKTALVLPDIATCPDCLREILDPQDRRYRYPFTNCTNCGPRFSIIEELPYDRAHTSMQAFAMCPECQAEYDDPRNRRFHAQPNACPVCGPHLELWDPKGVILARADQALMTGADALRTGKVVAVKGLGGFHLVVTAENDEAVQRLRRLKHREEKPFALMFPSLEAVKAVCEVSPLEERLLRSPEAPIVLLRLTPHAPRPRSHSLSSWIAPGNPNLGVMLPYTPLHHLLLAAVGSPVVATSGNLSDEPICTNEHEALERLGSIADLFLIHNRPIVRHVDDSIVRVMAGRELVLRRARGYAPLPVPVRGGDRGGESVLAVGAHLKNTIALSVGPQAFISQHIGDLESDPAYEAFRHVIGDFEKLYETSPSVVAADAHPDYLSTRFAGSLIGQANSVVPGPETASGPGPSAVQGSGFKVQGSGFRVERSESPPRLVSVQHHLAHVLSCMAENEIKPPVLGVSWDGTGYGLDGTVWGGEFFLVTEASAERSAHLRPFRLPGGDKAVKEPRRTALGLLFARLGAGALERDDLAPIRAFSRVELAGLGTMLARQLNSPLTSSVGRLFDAVASLAGLRHQVRFEGQAAMELEFALEGVDTEEAYPFSLSNAPAAPHALLLDWVPTLDGVLADLGQNTSPGLISARFHNALVRAIILVAGHFKLERVVLSGGCFQNRYLTEHAVRELQVEGFRPYWHQRVPPNDGGISLGQIAAVMRG